MDAIEEEVAGIAAIGASRVFQGKKRFVDATDHGNDVRGLTAETQGYFTFWIGRRSSNAQAAEGELIVEGELEVRLPKDTTTDVNSAYDLAEAVTAAVGSDATFAALAAGVRPSGIDWQEAEDGLENDIMTFAFTMRYQLPRTC